MYTPLPFSMPITIPIPIPILATHDGKMSYRKVATVTSLEVSLDGWGIYEYFNTLSVGSARYGNVTELVKDLAHYTNTICGSRNVSCECVM